MPLAKRELMITVRREKNLMFRFNQISKIGVAGWHIHVGSAGFLATVCCYFNCQCRLYVFKYLIERHCFPCCDWILFMP